VRAVQKFPTPKRVKDIQSFVALCGYYRRFIKNFARVARPLTLLTCKDTSFKWTEKAQSAFDSLKDLLSSTIVLGYPDEFSPVELHCDGSGLGLGVTLVMIQNGVERVIAYASRALKPHEKNFSSTDLECLAVLFGITKFRPYLFGRHFKVITDHKALTDLINFKDPHGRAARMSMALQPYDFEIIHRSGRKHADADALSRNVAPESPKDPEIFSKAQDQIDSLCSLIDKKLFSLCALQIDSFDTLQHQDPAIRPIIDSLVLLAKDPDAETPIKRSSLQDFNLEGNILYKAAYDPDGRLWRLVVPKPLVKDLLAEIHVQDASHLGLEKTWKLVRARYYWPRMFKSVQQFCRSCKTCQLYNRRIGPTPRTITTRPPTQICIPHNWRRLRWSFPKNFPKAKFLHFNSNMSFNTLL